MIPLITKYDLDGYKYIADSVRNSSLWPQFVSEAQLLDVKVWLTDALLSELIDQESTNPSSYSAANKTLLNGGSYVYQTKTYIFQGLKAAIIYYAFARFTNRMSVAYTATGIVIKDSDLSTPASDKTIQRLETESRLTAEAIKCEVMLFLDRNYASYPLWENRCCAKSCISNRPFKVIGE
jgi:hypothetical protein